jgi:hypothetical protein
MISPLDRPALELVAELQGPRNLDTQVSLKLLMTLAELRTRLERAAEAVVADDAVALAESADAMRDIAQLLARDAWSWTGE